MVASYWEQGKEKTESKDVKCLLCPNYCIINDGGSGMCGVRKNEGGTLYASAYAKITSAALDPIEKKPLHMFCSGKKILSIGSFGCNFKCPFCQNFAISKEYRNIAPQYLPPDELLSLAAGYKDAGNIGAAFTYNEPLINFEYIKDCFALTARDGLKNVLVTNGYICEEPLTELLPSIDAMNIDIKGWDKGTYDMVGGTLENVLRTVELAHSKCHIEITTLIIPEISEDDIIEISKFLASKDKKIPYHLTRYFPRYKYQNHPPTPAEKMHKMKDIAERYLDCVFLGNL